MGLTDHSRDSGYSSCQDVNLEDMYVYVCVCVCVRCVRLCPSVLCAHGCTCVSCIYVCTSVWCVYMCVGLCGVCVYVCAECIDVCVCVGMVGVSMCVCKKEDQLYGSAVNTDTTLMLDQKSFVVCNLGTHTVDSERRTPDACPLDSNKSHSSQTTPSSPCPVRNQTTPRTDSVDTSPPPSAPGPLHH